MALLGLNHVFSVFGFVGFVVISILLPMHLRARNTGTCIYITWISLVCLIYAVNSIVWSNNMVNWAPIWCDISSHVTMAAGWGSQLGVLCIIRRLYRIITMKAVNQSLNETRRDLIVDLLIGVVIPVLLLPLQYIIESNRFAIFENVGCYPAISLTPPAIPLFIIWPVVLGSVTACYAGLTVHATIKRKAFMKKIMQSDQPSQNGHYWHLLTLSSISVICTLPYGLLALLLNIVNVHLAAYNWKSAHSDFSYIPLLPVSEWGNDTINRFAVEANRWIPVFYAFVFFAFFGFTKEARHDYRLIWHFITRRNYDQPHKTLSLPIHHLRFQYATFSPFMSGTTIGSLRFVSNINSSQVTASATRPSRFQSISLPALPSLIFEEKWYNQDHINKSFSVSQNEGPSELSRALAQPIYCRWDGCISEPIITRPAPVLEISSMSRRHSLNSARPAALQTLPTSTCSNHQPSHAS